MRYDWQKSRVRDCNLRFEQLFKRKSHGRSETLTVISTLDGLIGELSWRRWVLKLLAQASLRAGRLLHKDCCKL